MQMLQIQRNCLRQILKRFLKIILLPKHQPIMLLDLFMGIIPHLKISRIPPHNRKQPLIMQYRMIDFLRTYLRSNGIGTDHKHKSISRLNPLLNLRPPVRRKRNIIPIYPSIFLAALKGCIESTDKIFIFA